MRHMKKTLFILLILVSFVYQNAEAKKLQAFMSYSTFYSPTDGPYIESYLTVVGSSTVFMKNDSGRFQSTIEVTLIFSQNNVVKQFKKYNLLSPAVLDTNAVNFNFIDQQRFLLPNGEYQLDIQIVDKNDKAIPYKAQETIDVNYPNDKISVSAIELIQGYAKTDNPSVLTKSGYDLVPYILNYYPEETSKVTFYSEIYNTDKVFGLDEKYLLSAYIETYETGKLYGDLVKIRKESAKNVNIMFGEFDISSLPTGNYNIAIEVRDKTNTLIAYNKLFFQRNHPALTVAVADMSNVNIENTFVNRMSSMDTIIDNIKSLYPISMESERQYANTLIKKADLKTMQQYFYNFWVTRNQTNPEGAWLLYKAEVNKVNANYGTKIKRGYESDRGRVYLQYGPPNSIMESLNEPSAYPYTIWHYYALGNQKNKKFVFYNPDMVTNDFVLIHSDALGEVYDYKWKQRIYGRNSVTNDIDSDGVTPHWGDRSDDFFRNPR
jgi:GWxTD domain-containing protein